MIDIEVGLVSGKIMAVGDVGSGGSRSVLHPAVRPRPFEFHVEFKLEIREGSSVMKIGRRGAGIVERRLPDDGAVCH